MIDARLEDMANQYRVGYNRAKHLVFIEHMDQGTSSWKRWWLPVEDCSVFVSAILEAKYHLQRPDKDVYTVVIPLPKLDLFGPIPDPDAARDPVELLRTVRAGE
jgi:hypothetical protein